MVHETYLSHPANEIIPVRSSLSVSPPVSLRASPVIKPAWLRGS